MCGNTDEECISKNVITIAPGANQSTVDLWTRHQNSTAVYGRTWIGPYTTDSRHMNGNRDTIIFVPAQFDRTKQADIFIWLHGHNGFNKFENRILRHVPELYRRGLNPVFILVEQPWSHWTSTRTSRNGTGPFRQPGEFQRWENSMISMLQFLGVTIFDISGENVYLFGHSAGGSGILSMSRSDALEQLRPGNIIFSDSTYGSWYRSFHDNYHSRYPSTRVAVLVRRGTTTHESMRRFYRDRRGQIPETLRYMVLDNRTWTHKRIGDNCLLYPGSPFPP